MLTENDVIDAVADHLESTGWVIDQRLSTNQRGVDLVAEFGRPAARLLVEAKGGTSSKVGTNRHGKPFTPSQVRDHVAQALLAAARALTSRPSALAGIAVPDDANHRKELEKATNGLAYMGIRVFLVSPSKGVREWNPTT